MASSSEKDANKDVDGVASDADLAQAFKDLARGEKTAQALEANLTSLEKKIDDLLASFEKDESQRLANGGDGDGEVKKETKKTSPEDGSGSSGSAKDETTPQA